MVKILSLLLMLLITVSSHAVSAELTLALSNNKTELGKPVITTIIAKNLSARLSEINLGLLKQNFGIEVIESSSRTVLASDIQELKIAIYPRSIGEIILPPILFSGFKTKETKLTVTPAKIIKDKVEVISASTSPTVWQRQQIRVTATITTSSKFAKIELDDFTSKQLESTFLTSKTLKLSSNLYQHYVGWALYPLLSGKLVLHPPAISYKLNGKIQRKFFLPSLSYNVKELPSYVPPLMPVGTLSATSTIKEAHDNFSHYWEVIFLSKDIMPSTLSTLRIPSINSSAIKYGNVNYSISSNKTHIGTPISFENSGFNTIPELTYKIFNPLSGKIHSQTISSISVFTLNPWIKVIASILLLLFLIFLCYILIKYTRRIYIKTKNRRAIINSTLTAKSSHQLHAILNQYAENQGWGENMTLQHWLTTWQLRMKKSADDVINTLSFACYGNDSHKTTQDELNKNIFMLLSK